MYTKSVVAYVDILGFKERVKNCPAQQVRNDLKFAQTVGKIALDKVPGLRESFYSKAFSDSISMSVPADESSLLTSFFLHIVQFQAQLSDRGVFVRGAVTLGDHCEDSTVLFGHALIRAVELEDTVALWPRVIVDPEVIQFAHGLNLCLDAKPLEEDVVSLLRCDYDGISYVNYLGHFAQYPQWHGSRQGAEQFVSEHRDYVVKQLEANQSKKGVDGLRVLAKYHQLAVYHNSVMAELGWGYLGIEMANFL
jgi:hypothetical protein